jgi:putative cell wall-binding protein
MRRRLFVLVCCLILMLSATSMSAQSRGAKAADPLTGTWTGELVPPNAPNPIPITMELKFDGKSAVTGTFTGLPSPGDVKTGTFDPKTGALKLQMGKTDDSTVLLVFEGTVVKGAVSGSVTGEGGTGEFTMARKK